MPTARSPAGPGNRRPDWYDPGRFWSGDNLGLSAGFRLGGEIAVHIPARRTGPAGSIIDAGP